MIFDTIKGKKDPVSSKTEQNDMGNEKKDLFWTRSEPNNQDIEKNEFKLPWNAENKINLPWSTENKAVDSRTIIDQLEDIVSVSIYKMQLKIKDFLIKFFSISRPFIS